MAVAGIGRWAAREGAALTTAVRFLSRIPVPLLGETGEERQKRSLRWYAFVGVILGALLWVAAELLHVLRVPAPGAAALVVAADLWLTGGLHLDGWMDTADGLGSRRERERALEIMRDSRVGAFGVMTAIGALLTEWAFLDMWIAEGAPFEVTAAAWGIARWIMVWAVVALPYARAEGMGAALRGAGPGDVAVAGVALLIPGVPAVISSQWSVLLGAGVAFVAARFWAGRVAKRLGGLTGDVYGALCVFTQVCALVAMEVIGRWI
ncbi:adenosylcobinamide-GDP ribazoletransferase [Kyrpidia sp.]|uniref:adenosylcobinamide-GDP ribazoletransferase n=1 Tax=Kyrpidia sp. TaxID=2073077 RepID=UPI0025850ADD|nr:adenosylcobinamide-GDP ribazoletransferase [Kyrpidia sp.]MCL6576470.1 adenosylcobinamide-GDP ribazoletransferase [Kyrpidia sp.]